MRYEDLAAFLLKYSPFGVRIEIREEIFTVFGCSGRFTVKGKNMSESFSTVNELLCGCRIDGEPMSEICGEIYELSILCPQGA